MDDIQVILEETENERARLEQQVAQARERTEKKEAELARVKSLSATRQQIEQGQLSVQSEAKAAQAQYRHALETGDADMATQATARLTTATALQLQLERERQQVIDAALRPSDPVEAYAVGRAPKTQQWIREHGDWVTDPEKNEKLVRAHHAAIGDGLTPDTDEYFKHVERRIGLGEPAVKRVHGSIDPHDIASHIKDGGRRVQLTKGEAERATDGSIVWTKADLIAGRIKDPRLINSAIGPAEYGRRKLAMFRDGYYNRID